MLYFPFKMRGVGSSKPFCQQSVTISAIEEVVCGYGKLISKYIYKLLMYCKTLACFDCMTFFMIASCTNYKLPQMEAENKKPRKMFQN